MVHKLLIDAFAASSLLLLLMGSNELAAGAEKIAGSASSDTVLLRGELIYAEQCASCHGETGQGVEDGGYDEPLVGDDSVGELAERITDTMPEDDPQNCVGADAEAVAGFVHHSFYSEAARIRSRPPRVSLSHLTGRQLRQSLADLYAHFTGSIALTSEGGIRGTYFDGSKIKKRNQKIDRVDSVIDFDWLDQGPGDGIQAEDFGVRWQGGLRIAETGRYEIVIRSTCAFVCRLGADREFIDNHVQSGDQTEFRKSIVLTSGRIVPLEIDLYQRKRKTEQPPARISVCWIPPHGTEQVIPQRNLLPVSPPATFCLQAKLPPDDRSYGYGRGLSVDRQWDDSTTRAAVEFAHAAAAELWPEYRRQHAKKDDKDRAVLRRFLMTLAEIGFRGSPDEESQQFYVDEQMAQTADDLEAIRRCLLLILKSPRFLYPSLDQDQSDSRRAANRLALTLYDSLPADAWLIELVQRDELHTDVQIRAAAERMVDDYRTQAKTRQLMHEWLNLSRIEEVTKDVTEFPGYDTELNSDMRSSLNAFIDDIVWSEASDFRQLLLADWTYMTPRMEDFYELAHESGEQRSGLFKTNFDADQRVGVLTHPYLMSGLAYPDSTSPIHRGVFLIRYLLGRTLRPPQEAFTPLSPDLHPNMTTRQRVALQTSSQSCQVCHQKINGLGFVLENYDAVGRFRAAERGVEINATGQYTARNGVVKEFQGPRELAHFLANSNDAHRAFVNRAFQYFVKQPIAAFGATQLETLTDRFRQDGFQIRKLLVEIAVIASMQQRSMPSGES